MVGEKLKANKIDWANYDAVAQAYLPITLQRLWNFHAWDEKRKTETVSLSTNDYLKTLATDFDQIENITFKGTEELPPISVVAEAYLLSLYPNVNNEAAGIPAFAAVIYDSTSQLTKLLIAPKANKDYSIEVIGRRRVPGIDEIPGYMIPTLEKMFLEDLKLPGAESDLILSQAAIREGQAATNVTPKAVPDRPSLESGITRDGVHRFNMNEGFASD